MPPEMDHLGKAQPRLDGDQKKRIVASSRPGLAIRRQQQGFDLRMREKVHQFFVLALGRHREDPLNQARLSRILIGGESKERANRREAEIAAAGGIVTAFFQIIEKSTNQWRIQVREFEP